MQTDGPIFMIVDDMFFASKIRGTVNAAGREAVSVRSLERIDNDKTPSLILLDLNSTRVDPVETIQSLKASDKFSGVPIVGFLSHVQVDLKRAAEDAGCDYVIPRSLFSQALPQIVTGDLSALRR
jgi:CheY-like chemotaxis protein